MAKHQAEVADTEYNIRAASLVIPRQSNRDFKGISYGFPSLASVSHNLAPVFTVMIAVIFRF
ncbi:hypothetical protein RJ641_006903 [Dillenia turbinata]|uniref:Uncharacterized protein n=1 Tax=Dillenia turbinata TaxID=194707 RepID=A0AAN8VFD6_9MAGN